MYQFPFSIDIWIFENYIIEPIVFLVSYLINIFLFYFVRTDNTQKLEIIRAVSKKPTP